MHTDRGSQYCSDQFQRLLRRHAIRSSISAKGNCYDNVCAESFFHSLKVEAIHGEKIPTHAAMRDVILPSSDGHHNKRY